MFPTVVSQSSTLSLERVIARLAWHEPVDGLLLLGSPARGEAAPAGDYDLMVRLSGMPVPLRVAVTYIDRRLTDVIFVSTGEIEQLMNGDILLTSAAWDKARWLRWLRTGRTAFNRSGRLRRARQAANREQKAAPGAGEVYAARFSLHDLWPEGANGILPEKVFLKC